MLLTLVVGKSWTERESEGREMSCGSEFFNTEWEGGHDGG